MIERLQKAVESKYFLQFIMSMIILNSIILGMKSYPTMMMTHGHILNVLDDIMIVIFVMELLLYLYVYGFRHCLTDPWYIFDASVIIITVVSFEPAFSSLRAMRVLRVLRLVTVFPNLRKVVEGLIAAIPGIGSIGTLLIIVLYVFALISTNLFQEEFPKYFGDLDTSLFTLFQVMTAESWASNIARPVMAVHPYAWIFFVVFILSTTFIVLNLFIAVIVDVMQKDVEYKEGEEDKFIALKDIKKSLEAIEKRLDNRIE